MKFLIEAGPRALIILISFVISIYLLTLTVPSGERVSIEERWFEYGQASTPVNAESEQAPVALSLLSPVELDENGDIFYWITEYGDVIAASNLSDAPQQTSISIEVSNNPCGVERNFIIGTKINQQILTVPSKGSKNHTLNILIPAGTTEFLSLVPLPGNLCNLNIVEDERNFVGKISNIIVSTL
jgi:hypothetical protein